MAETMLDSDRVNVPQRLPVLVASFLSLVRCHNQVPWDELKTQLGAKEAAWKRGKIILWSRLFGKLPEDEPQNNTGFPEAFWHFVEEVSSRCCVSRYALAVWNST